MLVFFSPLLFALACNLDTVLLAAGFRLRGTRLSPSGALLIAVITTAITVLSLALGQIAAGLFPPGLPESLGGLVLVAMGFWFLLDWLRRPGQEDSLLPAASGPPSWVALAAALGVNNAGAGAAAGVCGVGPVAGGLANFAITFLALALGLFLGSHARREHVDGWALPASGLLLVLLGLLKALPIKP